MSWTIVKEEWVYVFSNGKLAIGMQTIAGKEYFFNEEGYLIRDGWIAKIGNDYYLEKHASFSKTAGEIYYAYATSTGELATGFVWIKGELYYFYPHDVGEHKKYSMARDTVIEKRSVDMFGRVIRTGRTN